MKIPFEERLRIERNEALAGLRVLGAERDEALAELAAARAEVEMLKKQLDELADAVNGKPKPEGGAS